MEIANRLGNESATTAQTELEAAQATAEAVVAQIAPHSRPHITRLAGGIMNFMFLARDTKRGKYVVRVYPLHRSKNRRFEPGVIRRLRSAGCAVPEVLDSFERSAARPRACFVYRYIEGTPLISRQSTMSSRGLKYLAREVVEQLLQFKGVAVHKFGNLVDADTAAEMHASEFIEGSLTSCVEACTNTGVLDDLTLSRLSKLASTAGRLWEKFDGALGWGDLSASNIIVSDSNRLAGLVDFEGTFALHLALSAGYLYAMQPHNPLFAAILDEFQSADNALDADTVRFFAVLRAVRMARYAGRELPTGIAQGRIFEVLPGAAIALNELAGKLDL
jgi:aminoglycoside phosphotransferase (APT) family kinase protein